MMYGKELSPDQMKRVIDAEQTQNPLFLMITVSEIVVFGYFRLLDKKIDSLITCNSVQELFENYLQRLEEDYNVSTFPGNLVEKVLLAILFSRSGISETELKEILTIPDSIWSPLYFAMEKYVIQHSGLLNFGFKELKTAVEKKYLKSPQDGKTILKQMIEYFEKKRKGFNWSVLHGDHDISRCSIELPFLQKQIGDNEGLLTTITDFTVFQSLFQEHNYEIIELWEATGCDTSEIIDRYLTNFDVRIADIYLKRQQNQDEKHSSPPGVEASQLLTDLRIMLGYVQKPVEGIKIMKRQIQVLENSKGYMDENKRQEALVRCQYFLAAQYVEMEDYETGVPIHEKIISDLEKLKEAGNISIDSLIVLAMSYNDIGVTLVSRREYEKAEKYFYKSMEIESVEGLRQEEGECLMNIALCRLEQGDTDKALELYLKTLEIFEDVFFGQLNHNLGQLMTNIGLTYRRQNKLEEAEIYYNRSLKIKAQALGWDNPDVAYVYMNLSVIEQLRSNLPKSIELITKAELIFKKRNADLYTNANYRKVFENRVLYIVLQERYEDAEEEYQKILNVLMDKGLMDFCLKGLHLEMLKFYIRSEQYDKATKTALAILSRANPEPTDFTYLDHLDALKPIEERPQREYKYSLERAFDLWPDNGDIGRRLARNNYIPRNLTDKLLQHLQKIDKNVEGLGAMTYGYASDWCCEDQKSDLALTVLRKGFEIYPDSMEIIDRLTTILRENKDYAGLLEFLQPVTKRIDNSALHYIAGYSAIMQGQFDLARELLKRIIDKDSDPDPDIMLQKATDLYNSIDQFESETKKIMENKIRDQNQSDDKI
ncbi:TPR repeat-containing protein DDB_G0287407 [Patella vulgata]|uniref:TPR repeat-containing protein DDB_G0287407 n=1 Tax=Patella vulgata TaxID=6465 RepID=UPI0021804191|nr:TPR repeat-containing protein DDB_G0287407 [Patella vulgata]